MKPGLPPGPNNPLTPTTTFAQTDAIEMDFVGVKTTTVGPYYYEFVNSITGESVRSSKDEQELSFSSKDAGTGTDLNNVAPGDYDLNIYLNNQLIFTTQIKVTS
jgi:hypothetical protein